MTKYWQSRSLCRGMNVVSKNVKYLKNLRTWEWQGTESNCRHEDFQSSALPTELPGQRLETII